MNQYPSFDEWIIVLPDGPMLVITRHAMPGATCDQCLFEDNLYLVGEAGTGAHTTATCHTCMTGNFEARGETGERFYQPAL